MAYPVLRNEDRVLPSPAEPTERTSFYPTINELTSLGKGLITPKSKEERNFADIIRDSHLLRAEGDLQKIDQIFHPEKYLSRNRLVQIIETIFSPWVFTYDKIDMLLERLCYLCFGKEQVLTNDMVNDSEDKLSNAYYVLKPHANNDRVKACFEEHCTKIRCVLNAAEQTYANLDSEDVSGNQVQKLRQEALDLTKRKIETIVSDYEKVCKSYLKNRY